VIFEVNVKGGGIRIFFASPGTGEKEGRVLHSKEVRKKGGTTAFNLLAVKKKRGKGEKKGTAIFNGTSGKKKE